jgi:sigma-B regulation protein RsbU (phosphoserine phosphatase)
MAKDPQSPPGRKGLARELEHCRERIRRLTMCAEVSRLISSSLELEEVLDRIMTTSRDVMQADASSLLLLDEESDELVFQVAQSKVGDRLKHGFRLKRGQGIAGAACETGEPILIEDAYKDPRFHREFDLQTGYRTRSILCVPLKIKDRVIGVSQVINKLDGTPFTQEDLATFTSLCAHAAIAIENARIHRALLRKQQMESDLAFATTVQQSFLPQGLPEIPGFWFRAHYQSAQEVGGDFYDFIPLRGKRLGILIGDVAGKGVSSALYMARLTSDFRFLASHRRGAAQAVEGINELLCQRSQRGMFVTLLYLILDASRRSVQFVNAGHLPPVLWNGSKGHLVLLKEAGGPPLGILPGRRYRSARVELDVEDCLALATDGVLEAKDPRGTPFGWDRFLGLVSRGDSQANSVLGRVIGGLREFVAGSPPTDDITLVTLSLNEAP